MIHVKGGKWPLDKAYLCSVIRFPVLKMQLSKNKDSESTLYTPGQSMPQTLMQEGNKQIIMILFRERIKTTVILYYLSF